MICSPLTATPLLLLGAMFLIWRPSCVLSGIGILLLYAYAVDPYGIFHLIDYVFFPCLAVYFIALPLSLAWLNRLHEPLLVAELAFSLAWTAIEKFYARSGLMRSLQNSPSSVWALHPRWSR